MTVKWKWEVYWFWTRIYLLPIAYIGRHEISHIIEDAGPTWMFQVGWLFLTVGANRYVSASGSR